MPNPKFNDAMYDAITLNEIDRMPFITPPSLQLKYGEMERVVDIARRNKIHWRKCLRRLYTLNRDPYWQLRWLESHDGTLSVCVDLDVEGLLKIAREKLAREKSESKSV